jgi:hypothetical protein
VKELRSIVDYGRYDPAIDSTYFPGTNPDGYWSSSTYAYCASHAWGVAFLYGGVDGNGEAYTYYVRCVR